MNRATIREQRIPAPTHLAADRLRPGGSRGRSTGTTVALAVAASLLLGGCATKKFVRGELDRSVAESETRTGERIGQVETRLEENQSAIAENRSQIAAQGEQITELSKTAEEALDRAVAAGRLAEGTLLSETVLSDDSVSFQSESAELSDAGKEALAAFAAPLKEQNTGVFFEIQGHTDSTGSEEYNYRLGQQRAEAVRRHLNLEHGFPLHRMSVISYGESEPAHDNKTREGRAKNRRVVIVVLK
ncbi:MAG: OmpA family protein [Acidobacteria bacterium]|nr:MAG: OmpA family protein [Acidobacteriota bacterium]REK11283.1 MAG: OmpA family protein [Acidobacteriota bacterium]